MALSERGVYIQVEISLEIQAYGISIQMKAFEWCTKDNTNWNPFGPRFEVWVDVPPLSLLPPRMLHPRLAPSSPRLILIMSTSSRRCGPMSLRRCERNTPPFLVCAHPRARRKQESVQSPQVPVCKKIKGDRIPCNIKQRHIQRRAESMTNYRIW